MTTEEKARAYDEALKRVKAAIDMAADKDLVKGVATTIFPELRESEDESLKNKSGYYKAGKFWKASTLWQAVKNKIPQRVPNRYILQECTWNIGTLQQFANEVKNIQEVSLDYPIILDINGNILDGAHRVVKAYLEGKDIDVVYLGDDEWPEPDYDEEKAVKESEDERIGKAIIKSIEEDSSVYEQEVSKEQMLAYLEKQKEASKAIEAVDRIDKYIDEHLANAHDMKDSNPEKKYYRGWDDALGKMAGILQDVYSEEKQKEQKPNTVSIKDATKFGNLEYERGVKDGIQSEKSRQWKPSEEELNLLRYLAKNIDVASHERHVLDNMIDRLMAV